MTREMHNVSMLSDEEVTIEGETYNLEKGDIVALSFKTARNYVNQFGIAEFVGKKYPILDEEYEDTVGPTGDKADGLKDNNPSKGAGKALADPEQPSNERFETEDESEEDEEESEEDEDVDESEDEEPEEDETEEEESESGDVDVTELTVSEVEDEVAEVEDVEVLNGMLKYEKEGDDRKGAKEAINARLEELDSEADDESEESEDTE